MQTSRAASLLVRERLCKQQFGARYVTRKQMIHQKYDLDLWRNRARKAHARATEERVDTTSVSSILRDLMHVIEVGDAGRMQPKDYERVIGLTQELEERIDLLCKQKVEEEKLRAERERERQRLLVLFGDGQRVPLRNIAPNSIDHRLTQMEFPADVLLSVIGHVLAHASQLSEWGDIDWELQRTTNAWEGTLRMVWMDEYSIWPRVLRFGEELIEALKIAIERDKERFPCHKIKLACAHQTLAEYVTIVAERPTEKELAKLDTLERLRTFDMLRDAITHIDTLMGQIFSNPELLANMLEIPPEFAQFRRYVLQSEAAASASLPELRSWLSELAQRAVRGNELSPTELSLVKERLGPTWEHRLRHLPWMIELAAASNRSDGSKDRFIFIRTLEQERRVLDALTDFFGEPSPKWLADHRHVMHRTLDAALRRDCLG